MAILVILQHDGERIRAGSRSAIAAARQLSSETGEPVELLLFGTSLDPLAAEASRFAPVIRAEHALLQDRLAERDAPVIAAVARGRSASIIDISSSCSARRKRNAGFASLTSWVMRLLSAFA